MITFDQLEMFIDNIIEKDELKLTAFSKDTMRYFELSGRTEGYKKGLEAVKRVNQAEPYKDVLNTVEEQINQYKKDRANSVMESNADPDSFDKKMKIIFYDNALDALVSAEAAIKSLLPYKKERKENYKVDQPLAINILKFVGAILLYIVFSPFIIVSVIYKGIKKLFMKSNKQSNKEIYEKINATRVKELKDLLDNSDEESFVLKKDEIEIVFGEDHGFELIGDTIAIISRDEIEGSISRLEKASGTKVSA